MSKEYLVKQTSLNNIKSQYFSIFIFSFLDEKKKLEIIKYNKNLQNTLDIKMINYKFYKGKCIIYELNGNTKEYNEFDDNIEFEGEYLNGKRNGKGKEYYFNGNLRFEGDYLNGKRNGKGKEYYDDCHKIIFEGEYKNGLRWNGKGYDNNNNVVYELKNGNGYVKEYYSNGKLEFEVEYLNGNKHGKIEEYYSDGNMEFEGEYFNGYRNGKGREYNYDGNLEFEGEFFYGKRWNGKGYDNNNNIVYELKNGNGYVKEYNINRKLIFEGEYLNGETNGKGKEYDYEGNLYFEGEYLNGLRNGKGKEYDKDNLIFEGEYLYDHKLRGKHYINGILEYEGEYLYNKKWNGKGYDENGNIIYELINGNGKVKEYEDDKLKYEGEYLNGKRNGKGKEYNYDSHKILFEGKYKNGLKWTGKGYGEDNNMVYELNNGKGYVKEYDYYSFLVSEGEYVNGQKNGKGKDYDWVGNLYLKENI